MLVRKAFKFSLRPTKKQKKALEFQLEECRWLYNALLEQRKLAFEELEFSLTKYDQMMFLPLLKEERPSLENAHSQVLQNVVDRLDKSFVAFFRRCKEGGKPGFPRFRGVNRYNSFCYPQTGFKFMGKELKLSKVGSVPVKMHRPIEGTIKTCTLRRSASGKWEVSLSCELEIQPLQKNEASIGIDVGIEHFATLSDGKEIKNPRFFKTGEKTLAKAQKKLMSLEKGTKERKKQGKVVAKIHEKIGNRRKDFCHKESRKIINSYGYIYIEDLDIQRMVEKKSFAKSILDVSWNQFRQFLTYKAEEAGRKIGMVNPAYTSQDCSKCGYREEKKLSDRT